MTSIITGDIVNSRNISADEWLPVLKNCFKKVGNSPEHWEIFRGDSFQIEIKDSASVLVFAFKLKATIKKIKGIDVRLGIGIGNKNFEAKNITEANGEVFVNSGFAFDNLLKKQRLAVKSPWQEFDEIINTSLSLAMLIMNNWTKNSAEFVEMCLLYPDETQKLIAKRLNISKSSASERKKRAGLNEILRLEKLYKKLIVQKTM